MTEHDGELERALRDHINRGWESTNSHFADMKHGFISGFDAGRAHERASFAEECVRELSAERKPMMDEATMTRNAVFAEAISIISRLAQERGGE